MNAFDPISTTISATTGLVKEAGSALDNLFTSDEERLQARNILAQMETGIQEKVIEAGNKMEEFVTERHKADMQSDSKLSKSVRPITLIACTVFTMVIIWQGLGLVGESPAFEAGLTAMVSLTTVVFGFYFGSRGLEKVAGKIAEAVKRS